MADGQNRTYPATPRRLQKARDKGDVPLSREVVGVLTYGVACAALGLLGLTLTRYGTATLRAIVGNIHNREITGGAGLSLAMTLAIKLSVPVLLSSAAGGTLAVLVQTRFLFHNRALRFDLSRLDPGKGLKRLFGLDGLIELSKSMAKLILMAAATWWMLAGKIGELASLPLEDASSFLWIVIDLSIRLLASAGIVQLLMALLDLLIVRFRFHGRHKMTREDLKDEFKETEGNPHTKSRIRRLQRMKRRQMTLAVKTATVVITNPTHYAVALSYDKAISAAPRVAAKGADIVAQFIKELAKSANVPVVESPALARALFCLEWDTEIPPEHYKAVAEIVAFVWRIKGLSKRRR